MASYQEISDTLRDNILLERIVIAIGVSADIINKNSDTTSPPWSQTNNANRKKWAKAAYSNPISMGKKMQLAVLAANKDATLAQILGVGDTAIQNAVNLTVDTFADGL